MHLALIPTATPTLKSIIDLVLESHLPWKAQRSLSDPHSHLGLIWYYSEPSEVPYSTNKELSTKETGSNLVTFTNTQLTQASFLQKNQTLQNVFLIVVTMRWHRASEACKNQSF